MAIAFQKAKRQNVYPKILLGGPAGSGKTFSALRMATGYAKKAGTKVAAIDTEAGRIRYYATEFEFDDLQISDPFTPEKYIEAIDAAISGGYKVLIIDSITHEWIYCNTIHDAMPGNSYTNWGKVTPRHNRFMEKIIQSPLAIFATVRGKDEYVQGEKDGKKTVEKQGVGYTQRKDLEYDYTCTFNLVQNSNVAVSMKDNTHVFEGRYDVLTEKDGELIYDWANSGEAVAVKFTEMKNPDEGIVDEKVILDSFIESITTEFSNKINAGNDKAEMYSAIAAINNGEKSWLKLKNLAKAKEILVLVQDFGVETSEVEAIESEIEEETN